MSLHDYEVGKALAASDVGFYALVQAAMRRADGFNQVVLQQAFPAVWRELAERYEAPGGVLPSDPPGRREVDHAEIVAGIRRGARL